jgi:hypothetical protein
MISPQIFLQGCLFAHAHGQQYSAAIFRICLPMLSSASVFRFYIPMLSD